MQFRTLHFRPCNNVQWPPLTFVGQKETLSSNMHEFFTQKLALQKQVKLQR